MCEKHQSLINIILQNDEIPKVKKKFESLKLFLKNFAISGKQKVSKFNKS
jgi:hypothetical protein